MVDDKSLVGEGFELATWPRKRLQAPATPLVSSRKGLKVDLAEERKV